MPTPRILPFLLFFASILLLSPEATAQKSGTKYRPFPAYGFEFKPMKKWSDVPITAQLKQFGVIGNLEDQQGPWIKASNNQRLAYHAKCTVFKIDPRQSTTKRNDGKGPEDSDKKNEEEEFILTPESSKYYIAMLYRGSLDKQRLMAMEPDSSDLKAKGIHGRRETFQSMATFNIGDLEVVYDVFTFRLPDYKIVFVWDYPAEKKLKKKWMKAVEKSMKSFRLQLDDIETSEVRSVNSESTYTDLVDYHSNEVKQTPGWRLVETPSKNYLIKTNSPDKKKIAEVIKRLEASRRLFEEDFPPSEPITSISVVRICGSASDFQRYGEVPPGVAGFFQPSTEELVLYFGEGGSASTLSVVTHEGFHQYCHFLFNRSEAHRWYDEGHGDYYGAWKMKGKKLVPNEDMKGGLARAPELKTMIRQNSVAPLKKHLRFDHRSWQSQGPSNVSCYAQSFSIIYFLREGARGKVKRKYWKKEYKEIIPNYIFHLNAGFEEAYAEIQKTGVKRLKELKAEGGEFEELEEAREMIERPWDVFKRDEDGGLQKIWDKAMAESWGKIDELEFEDRWLDFAENEM